MTCPSVDSPCLRALGHQAFLPPRSPVCFSGEASPQIRHAEGSHLPLEAWRAALGVFREEGLAL